MIDEVKMIPIDRIHILNPRYRDRKKFEVVIQSIKVLGLKKPIQVSVRTANETEGVGYDLVCGQGRIEAFVALGHKEIPAIVVEISKEERLLRSLVENMARRFPAPMDMLREIERLKAQGYSINAISQKIDINDTLIRGLLTLKKAGEQRLLEAAVQGRIPLGVAIDIARTDSIEAQRALLKAFESKKLDAYSIRTVKRIIDQRRFFGKHIDRTNHQPRIKNTAENLVNVFKRETARQKLLIQKSKICDTKLVFIVTALNRLLDDENFVTLLRAESLPDMPKCLWSKLAPKHKEAA